jgi:flagellar protein FliS
VSYQKHLQVYQNSAVQSASPLQLVIMLYDGAIRFMRLGQEAMKQADLYRQNEYIQKSQKIVAELMSCLDMQKGGPIAENLFALYTYAYNQMVQANVEDNEEALLQSIRVLEQLRESWVELERQARSGDTGENNGEARAA